jgi:hypothetical protein
MDKRTTGARQSGTGAAPGVPFRLEHAPPRQSSASGRLRRAPVPHKITSCFMKKATSPRTRSVPRERRIDVTRIEYDRLMTLVQRNADAIQRLQLSDEIQLRRTAEVQAAIDGLKAELKR